MMSRSFDIAPNIRIDLVENVVLLVSRPAVGLQPYFGFCCVRTAASSSVNTAYPAARVRRACSPAFCLNSLCSILEAVRYGTCLDFLHEGPFLRSHLRSVRALHSSPKRFLIISSSRFSCHEPDSNSKSFGSFFTRRLTALNTSAGILHFHRPRLLSCLRRNPPSCMRHSQSRIVEYGRTMLLQMPLMPNPSFLCRHASSRSPATGSFSLRIDWSSCFLLTLGMNSDPEPSVFSFANLSGGNSSL